MIAEEYIEQIKLTLPIPKLTLPIPKPAGPISEMQFTKVETEQPQPSPIQDNQLQDNLEPVGHFFSCFNLCEWS